MTNEEILANAPEGATHYNYKFYLRLIDVKWEFYSFGKWNIVKNVSNKVIRSLSDIRRIVELEERLEASERERDYHEKTIEVFRDWFTALRDHHVCNFATPTTKAFIGNLEVHLYWYTISELLSGGGELDTTSNKFAIEQQIKVLEDVLSKYHSVANQGSEKDQADYIWCHNQIAIKLHNLRQQLNGGK